MKKNRLLIDDRFDESVENYVKWEKKTSPNGYITYYSIIKRFEKEIF